jgi:hypothetical protein
MPHRYVWALHNIIFHGHTFKAMPIWVSGHATGSGYLGVILFL